MSVISNNLLYSITSEAINRLIAEKRTIVWYSGKRLLGVVNDCINILGGKIDYALVDDEKINECPVDYVWSIPLINKHICVDISKSSILSKFHIELNQPKAVDARIIDVLGNTALYVISSKRADEMVCLLKSKGIDDDNILRLITEDESVAESNNRIAKLFEGKKLLSLEEIHKTGYEILLHFKKYCEENNLRYWLGGGTMLGAVRHEGFIPWDDDVDVFMPDSDYRRFLSMHQDDDQYELLTHSKVKGYPFYFSKLSDKRSLLWHHEYPIEYVMGAYIDIFPLVGYPDDVDERSAQFDMEHLAMAEWYWYKAISAIVGVDKMPLSEENILDKMIMPAFDESPYVGQVSAILQKPWVSKRDDFSGYINKKFEKAEFRIPVGYDNHLKERYGDYMTLPPVEKRATHSFPMYR